MALPGLADDPKPPRMAGRQADGEVWTFLVEHFDPHAQLKRQFHLKYFTETSEMAMVDLRNGKVFLKKSRAPRDIEPRDLVPGGRVVLHARSMHILDYADEYTRGQLATARRKTVLVVQASAVHHAGAILNSALGLGLSLVRLRMQQLDAAAARELHGGDAALARAAEEGPSVAMELVGPQSVDRVAQMVAAEGGRYAPGGNPAAALVAARSDEHAAALARLLLDRRHGRTATFDNATCCVIRPHALRDGHAGAILELIQSQGYEVSAMELFQLERTHAAEFLEVYDGVLAEFNDMVLRLSAGPCLALEVRAEDAVNTFRQTAGPWDVEMARELRPNTIRARWGVDRISNAVHCTDLPDDGVLECEYFFDILAS